MIKLLSIVSIIYESVEKTLTAMNNESKSTCSIEKESYVNSMMKLIGIDSFEELDDETVANDINMKNFENFNNKFKVLQSYGNPKNKLQTSILKMPGDIHKHVKQNY